MYGSRIYHLFPAEDDNGASNHSRIKMDLSALNAQGKRYNFITDSKCNFCNHKTENAKHVLLFRSDFAVHRQVMMDEMERLGPQTRQLYLNYKKKVANWLVYYELCVELRSKKLVT